jgi:hypothetical protein
MKKLLVIITTLSITMSSFAQVADTAKHVPSWTKGGLGTLNFGQASFTNWAAGGENSVSIAALLNVFANYKKGNNSWDNSLDLAYGMLQSGNTPLRKNEDKIDFSSKYGRKAFNDHWYYTVLVNFKSQFADGYNYPNDSVVISHFMAPGYLLGSIGMDYKTKDNSLSLYLSPLTSKTTFVNDQKLADAGAYGVNPAKYDTVHGVYGITQHGDMVLYQFGAYLKFVFKKDIFKNVNFATKLELFSNYLKDPQNIVVNWENILGMKVNKYLSASVTTNLIYDNNIPVPVKRVENGVEVMGTGPRVQFKEVLAIGLSYKF